MPSPDHYWKQHDTTSPITRKLEDAGGTAVNLAGGTVKFIMRPINGTANKINAAAALVSGGSAGDVSYTPTGTDTSTAGLFLAEWQATFASGLVQSFPNGGYDLILISSDLGG